MRSCLFGGVAIVGLAFTSAVRADVVDVYVYDFDYSTSPELEPVVDAIINVGDTVRWTWVKGNHSVTSATGQLEFFDSGVIFTLQAAYEHTFTNQGTFWYYCQVNGFDNGDGTASGMSGTITVRSVPAPAGAAVAIGAMGLVARRRRR